MATVNLSWTAPTTGGAATSYNLYRLGYAEGSVPSSTPSADAIKSQGSVAGNPGASDTTFSDTGVSSRNTYYYTIAGENTGGEGALSNVATAAIP
tara:strand:+ start:6472 stop:6756 length:285 start_codon:yes stop_codon:yes gene_type:complete